MTESSRRTGGTGRPHVVVSVVATVDGRVALGRAERLLDAAADRRWRAAWPEDTAALMVQRAAAIEDRHHPTVVLEGSGSFVADDAGPLDLPATTVPAEELWQDHLPYRAPRWFAVVDGRGRVPWSFAGDAETRLLVIVSRGTPLPYLAHLRREGISYLLAGHSRVDLEAALVAIRRRLGAACVVSEAGGGLNGALLDAGLVDELHVLTVPALVGGLGTPSIIDGPPRLSGFSPVRLRTVGVTVGTHGSIWSHYEVTSGGTA